VNAPVNLPAAIARYQDSLQYAGSQVNFVFGAGLYMSPSVMVLDIGRGVVGYDNKLLTADNVESLSTVADVNKSIIQQDTPASDDFAGKINLPGKSEKPVGQPSAPVSMPVTGNDDHTDEKITIAVLATVTLAAGLYYWRGRLL
jgi:hypothetical protein